MSVNFKSWTIRSYIPLPLFILLFHERLGFFLHCVNILRGCYFISLLTLKCFSLMTLDKVSFSYTPQLVLPAYLKTRVFLSHSMCFLCDLELPQLNIYWFLPSNCWLVCSLPTFKLVTFFLIKDSEESIVFAFWCLENQRFLFSLSQGHAVCQSWHQFILDGVSENIPPDLIFYSVLFLFFRFNFLLSRDFCILRVTQADIFLYFLLI